MNYLELLRSASEKFNSIISLGLDPVIEDIPISHGTIKERILSFYESILNRIIQSRVYPSAVKPNYAFYAQYGLEGIEALVSVIDLFKGEGFPIILDVKRGDISKTATAYSKESFEFFKADAVTLSPYMGIDSISPFMMNYPNKGFYILIKTSNNSSHEIQDVLVNGNPLFIHISKKVIEWYKPGIGAVVGATYPKQIGLIIDSFIESNRDIPLLIPGIGSQHGNLSDILKILTKLPDIRIHRINSSSSINYAYKNHKNVPFDRAAVDALKKLNDDTEIYKYIKMR